jgi:RNA polymerase sigma-70 factor (ECF subfamily)
VVAAELRDAAGESSDARLAREERGAILRRAIDSLGRRQRTAVLLFHYECLSYEQIAGLLGTTVPATKSLLVRGRATLRYRLSPAVSLL